MFNAYTNLQKFGGPLLLALIIGSAAHSQATRAYLRIETGEHVDRIGQLSVDEAERWLVTASDDKTARIWNLQTGRLERILRPPIGEGAEGKLYAVAVTPDGGRIALGGFTGAVGSPMPIYLFESGSGKLIGSSRGFNSVVNRMSFSHDGRRLAIVGTRIGMRILDATDLTHELARDDDCVLQEYGVDFDGNGRLVTSCLDGFLRLYDEQGRLTAKRKVDGGNEPFSVRFSPDSQRIAVGFYDTTSVNIVSGGDLTSLYHPDMQVVTNGNLGSVTWSKDGQRLYAAGRFDRNGLSPVVAWTDQGRGKPVLLDAAPHTVFDFAPLTNGRLVFGSGEPVWGVLGPNGERERLVLPAVLDYSRNQTKFRLSRDGKRVEFGSRVWGGRQWSHWLARFDLTTRSLETAIGASTELKAALTEGLPVTDWQSGTAPKFKGEPLKALQKYETSRALSIAVDRSGFVLGTGLRLRGFDATGHQRWQQAIPGVAWAVNQSEDGRFVVAALGDGTIRWYESASGRERLALFVHARDHRWVLFTPEGFYQASPGGDALIGYHLNQGPDHEGKFVDSAQLSAVFFRPDVITRRLAGDESAIAQAVESIGDIQTVLEGDLPPSVTLLSPVLADSDGAYELSVRISPAHGGARVGELKLFVNGAEVPSRAISPPGGGVVTQRLMLAPGQNTVSVRAMRGDGKVASNEVVARVHVRDSQVPPVLRVLAVGISQYDDATFKSGVKFAARDAADFAKQLSSQAQGMYREVDQRVLNRREDTSLARIDQEIQALVTRSRPEDVVVVFLAGHGKAPEGLYHFIPADFIYDSDQAFDRGTTLSQVRLEAMLKELGVGKRLLILDTCDSGSATEGRDGATALKDAIARLIRTTGRYILAAASPEGKALEDGVHGHGVYTYALLEGLAGAADPQNSGVIEVDALADYVSRRVPELTAPAGYQQRPMRSASGENFPIARHLVHP